MKPFLLSGHINSKNNVFWVWVRRFQTKCFRGRFIPLNILPGCHEQARDHRAFWFKDDDGRSQTVNKERDIAVLNKYWASLGRRREVVTASQWFLQDGTKRQCIPRKSTNNWGTENCHHSKNKSYPERGVCKNDWQLSQTSTGLLATKWWTFGTHLVKAINWLKIDRNSWNSGEWSTINWMMSGCNLQ